MENYKFIQRYRYGNDWDGEIVNIPDSALFYNVDNETETCQEWYVMIPIKDFNDNYEGCGCCQVSYFVLMDYVIIHLKNITPVGMWYDIGEYAFNETFEDKFKEWYVYEYKQAMYNYVDNEFVEVESEVLLGASRIKELVNDCRVKTTTVYVNDRYIPKETLGIIQSYYDVYDLDKLVDDEDDLLDDEFRKKLIERTQYKVSIEGDRYLLITKDSSLYEKLFKEVKDKLY